MPCQIPARSYRLGVTGWGSGDSIQQLLFQPLFMPFVCATVATQENITMQTYHCLKADLSLQQGAKDMLGRYKRNEAQQCQA